MLGMSRAERGRRVRAAVGRHAEATELVMTGHIFRLVAKDGGV